MASTIKSNTIDTVDNTALTIKQNDTTAITVNTSQNVGVGSASPSYKLHIDGSDGANPLLWVQQTGNGTGGIRLTRANSGNNNGDWQIDHSSQGLLFKHSPIANSIASPSWTTVLNMEGNNNGYDFLPQDAVTSLGSPSNRFDDLYLNGELYLGGTGSANALDDYEEGTFTASLRGGTTEPGTLKTTTAVYKKIGSLVMFQLGFEAIDNTGYSGQIQVSGLPFTNTSASRSMAHVGMYSIGIFSATNTYTIGTINASATDIKLQEIRSNNTWGEVDHSAGGGRYLWITGTYSQA